jgi:hypothetical protein
VDGFFGAAMYRRLDGSGFVSFVLELRPESSQGRGSDPFYARGFLINPNDTKSGLRVEALVGGSFVERSGLLRIDDSDHDTYAGGPLRTASLIGLPAPDSW